MFFDWLTLDLALLALLGFHVVRGWRRGFVASLIRLISFVAVFVVTYLFWDEGMRLMAPYVGEGWWLAIIWTVTASVGVAIAGWVVTAIVNQIMKIVSFVPFVGTVNAFLGSLLGALQAGFVALLFLCAVTFIGRVHAPLNDWFVRETSRAPVTHALWTMIYVAI